MYSSTKSPSKQAKTGDILTTKSVKRRVSEPSGQDAAPQWQELQGTAVCHNRHRKTGVASCPAEPLDTALRAMFFL